MSITKADVKDLDFIDAPELASTNKTNYRSGTSVTSTTSSTKTVTFTSGTLLINGDLPPEPGDSIVLSGTSAADGTYTVATIVDDENLTVSESIADSTGGSAAFMYPAGASKVGYYNTTSGLSAETVQGALDEIVDESLSIINHRTLDELTHELDENYYEEYTFSGSKISNVTVWTSVGKTLKIREYDYTYSGAYVSTETIKQYDGGGSLVETLTLTYVYSGSKISNVTAVRT